jgi:hypothetical protein
MDNLDFNNRSENNEKGSKGFWKGFGVFMLSLFLAVLTVVIINL